MLGCKLGFLVIIAHQVWAQRVPDFGYQWFGGCGMNLSCNSPLRAGWGVNNNDIFVGRAWYNGNLLPAKVMPIHGGGIVGLNGIEYTNITYEVLCGSDANWRPACNGQIPKDAFPVGRTSDGNILYYGRAHFENGLHSGKIDDRWNGLLIPFRGEEHLVRNYEILMKPGLNSYGDDCLDCLDQSLPMFDLKIHISVH